MVPYLKRSCHILPLGTDKNEVTCLGGAYLRESSTPLAMLVNWYLVKSGREEVSGGLAVSNL